MEWIEHPKTGNGDICPKSACYTNSVCGCKSGHSTGSCKVKTCVNFTGSCQEIYCVGYGGNR